MEEVKQVSAAESEKLQGIISMMGVGEVKCDKCGKPIRHMERYCSNSRECYHESTVFNSIAELNTHFVEAHSPEQPRGARYCTECSIKTGYLRMVRNKKTGEVFPAMFALRDEEIVEEGNKP
ncbi:MAG: hypothetical protein JW967_09160 [Dehalococcoidales bacterium]|nr:hypothetical protein [Dehalococcoidales bacterium]